MRYLSAIVSLALVSVACAESRPPSTLPARHGWSETGRASWYGPGFHGRRTASGEVYDMEAMTAAHKSLPFNTWVRVYDLDNKRSVDVRINDRGPFVASRIIDLSHAAARRLKMIRNGTAKVRLVVVGASDLLQCSQVQVGAFAVRANADALAKKMRAAGEPVHNEVGSDGLTRVLLGPYSDLSTAERALKRYRAIIKPCHSIR